MAFQASNTFHYGRHEAEKIFSEATCAICQEVMHRATSVGVQQRACCDCQLTCWVLAEVQPCMHSDAGKFGMCTCDKLFSGTSRLLQLLLGGLAEAAWGQAAQVGDFLPRSGRGKVLSAKVPHL